MHASILLVFQVFMCSAKIQGRPGRQAGRQAGKRGFFTEAGIRLKFNLSPTLQLLLYATLLHTTEKRKVTTRCAVAEGAIRMASQKLGKKNLARVTGALFFITCRIF